MNWEDIIKVGYIPSDARERGAPTINWMDAFHKFGFDDGEEYKGQTESIANFLEKRGYTPHIVEAGGHNTYISAVMEGEKGIAYPKGGKMFPSMPTRRDFDSELLKVLDDKYGKSEKPEGIKG